MFIVYGLLKWIAGEAVIAIKRTKYSAEMEGKLALMRYRTAEQQP